MLTYGGFLLLGGRAADLLGRRKVLVGGLILFALASLVAGAAHDDGCSSPRGSPRESAPR